MDTLDPLRSSVLLTHEDLAVRFDRARVSRGTPGEPRKGFELIDTFLALTCQHLDAVDAVLLPAARHASVGSREEVHAHQHAAKQLELALAHVKAREYGSVYDAARPWAEVWGAVDEALAQLRTAEFRLAERIAGLLPEGELERLSDRLHDAQGSAPTRPHPYAPHTGLPGLVARKVLHAVDAFWDTAEGRMVPEPRRPPHPAPGRFTQYLMGDPHFDDER